MQAGKTSCISLIVNVAATKVVVLWLWGWLEGPKSQFLYTTKLQTLRGNKYPYIYNQLALAWLWMLIPNADSTIQWFSYTYLINFVLSN